ncbi:multiheme c-type cytochrome [Roseimaritima ulvae]|uniref:multiheme c-type cytochrome n=1 Tax=Roseimaritima ulvae TaxID=980254 RepID=UPI001FD3C61B|nr:multiheme c-type cytochrome [Roseimaritima ulvae]
MNQLNPRRLILPIAVVIGLAAAMIYLTGGWNGTAGWNASPTGTPPPTPANGSPASAAIETKLVAWRQLIDANFAGDQACASCHEKEFQAHQRSGHSHTAIRMSASQLAARLTDGPPYQDTHREQTFRFEQRGDALMVFDDAHPQTPSLPVSWLLGSGTHAQTPIWVDEASQRGLEFRWSYLAHRDGLGLTPDHERFERFDPATIECYGRPLDAAGVRACLACHTTMNPPPELPIRDDLYIANVGCERCHGPRKKHVQMAEQGLAEQAQPLVQFNDATSYMAVCSQCHRDARSVSPDATANELARFQPYGLQRSRCYTESPGNMTCSTCHDPHDAVSTSRPQHIRNCQQCHQPNTSHDCPQKPTGDCIQCHMPAVEWTAGIAFHDHWIRTPTADE